MTVGSGISPDLLTPTEKTAGRSRARAIGYLIVGTYRRWGITPRPENVTAP